MQKHLFCRFFAMHSILQCNCDRKTQFYAFKGGAMTNCPRFIIGILLLCLIFSNTSAQPVPPWYETESNKVNSDAKIDSVAFYEQLIALENTQANYESNIAGMIAGGCLTGLGTIFVIYAATYESNKKTINECNSEKTGASKKACELKDFSTSTIEGMGEGLKVGFFYLIGGILSLTGLPIFIYNFSQYNNHKEHATYRNQLQQKLDYYKYRSEKNPALLIVIPTVNLMGGVGFNAILSL